ncbi:hypothetical protein DVH05_014695 [Phytophthora capsici]|nr:hypothetical protein DVH05_014695 [Phytophthora capsici]
MAIAHVSAQAQGIVENQVQLHANQQLQAQQQQQYTETQVQQARIEAKMRTDELADMIQANTIDPVALENHVKTQLQSVIVAANTDARAAAEEHLNKKTQATDLKMAAVLELFETQLRTNVETHVRQVLTAHMEQVGAEIRLAIARVEEDAPRGLGSFPKAHHRSIGRSYGYSRKKSKGHGSQTPRRGKFGPRFYQSISR